MPVKLFSGRGDRHDDLEKRINAWLDASGAIVRQISAAATTEAGQRPFVSIWFDLPDEQPRVSKDELARERAAAEPQTFPDS